MSKFKIGDTVRILVGFEEAKVGDFGKVLEVINDCDEYRYVLVEFPDVEFFEWDIELAEISPTHNISGEEPFKNQDFDERVSSERDRFLKGVFR
jgi:hypothetical protein